jgi:hypothetical protein
MSPRPLPKGQRDKDGQTDGEKKRQEIADQLVNDPPPDIKKDPSK